MTSAEGFKREGAQIEFISRITGLSKKQINEIAQEHKLH